MWLDGGGRREEQARLRKHVVHLSSGKGSSAVGGSVGNNAGTVVGNTSKPVVKVVGSTIWNNGNAGNTSCKRKMNHSSTTSSSNNNKTNLSNNTNTKTTQPPPLPQPPSLLTKPASTTTAIATTATTQISNQTLQENNIKD